MISLKSPSFDDRVQTSPQNDPIGEIVCDLEKQKAKIGMDMVKYKARMLTIRQQISGLEEVNNDFCVVLLLRYVLYKDWKFVCDNLKMSRSQANVIHGRALQEFDRIYSKDYRI